MGRRGCIPISSSFSSNTFYDCGPNSSPFEPMAELDSGSSRIESVSPSAFFCRYPAIRLDIGCILQLKRDCTFRFNSNNRSRRFITFWLILCGTLMIQSGSGMFMSRAYVTVPNSCSDSQILCRGRVLWPLLAWHFSFHFPRAGLELASLFPGQSPWHRYPFMPRLVSFELPLRQENTPFLPTLSWPTG